jgi:hypothetical protein
MSQAGFIRLQPSGNLQDQISTERGNRLIDEALDSGKEEPFTREKFEQTRQRARALVAAEQKAS